MSDLSIPELVRLKWSGASSDSLHIRIREDGDENSVDLDPDACLRTYVDVGVPECGPLRDGTGLRLRFGSGLSFAVRIDSQGALIGYTRDCKRTGESEFRHLLLDHVLPRVVAAIQGPVLHGALLEIGGAGVAIIGASGVGKSTLAAALKVRGARLLSDDAMQLAKTSTSIRAIGTYPSLRLWPDSLRKLFPNGSVSTPSGVALKRRIRVAAAAKASVPLRSVHILAGPSDKLAITRTNPARACMALVANAFQLDPTNVGAARETLEFMRTVAVDVPVYSVRFPHEFEELPAVCDAVWRLTAG